MPDEQTFLHALLANPSDDTLRLVFADWLEEQGDPRDRFLRLEVELHNASEATRAEIRELLHQARRGIDPSWLALVDRPQAGWRIVRKGDPAKAYGKAIPAFIHNFHFHYAPFEVCNDGAINCWGFVDLPLFRGKLAEGWVVPQAKVGDILSIYNLGHAIVTSAEWACTPGDLEQIAMDTIRELNPNMDGLLDMQGTDIEKIDGITYHKGQGLGEAKPYRITLSGEEVLGKELPVLEVIADGYRLLPWLIYADGLTQLGYGTELMCMEAVGQMFEEGRLTLSVPNGAWVTLEGLGRFQAGEGFWSIKPRERIREAYDLLNQLKGGPSVILLCMQARRAFEAAQSEDTREALRKAYGAVPEHLRRYCGSRIQRIIGEIGNEDVANIDEVEE